MKGVVVFVVGPFKLCFDIHHCGLGRQSTLGGKVPEFLKSNALIEGQSALSANVEFSQTSHLCGFAEIEVSVVERAAQDFSTKGLAVVEFPIARCSGEVVEVVHVDKRNRN